MTYLGTFLAEKEPLYVVALFGALMAVGLFISCFIKEDLRRVALSAGSASDLSTKKEKQGRKSSSSLK